MRKSLRIYGTAVLLTVLAVLGVVGGAQAAYPAHVAAPPKPGASSPMVPVTHGRLMQLNWQVISGNTVAFHGVHRIREWADAEAHRTVAEEGTGIEVHQHLESEQARVEGHRSTDVSDGELEVVNAASRDGIRHGSLL